MLDSPQKPKMCKNGPFFKNVEEIRGSLLALENLHSPCQCPKIVEVSLDINDKIIYKFTCYLLIFILKFSWAHRVSSRIFLNGPVVRG